MDRSMLKIEDELGSGQFGVVFKAFALRLSGDKEEYMQVAVKGLKGEYLKKDHALFEHRLHCVLSRQTLLRIMIIQRAAYIIITVTLRRAKF